MAIPVEPFHEIGPHAEVDADVSLGYRYPGDSQPSRIGNRCVVHHRCTLEDPIKIGRGVKIMADVYIPSHTLIGDLVFICPGVTIGKGSFIGAGSLVTKDGPPNTLALGCPFDFSPCQTA